MGGDSGSPVGDRVFECLQPLALGLHRGRDASVLITGDVVKRGRGGARGDPRGGVALVRV
jgi:hypothetical protein